MRHFLSVFGIVLTISGAACGQVDPSESPKHVILKWSPLSMFDYDNTFQVGVEIPLQNRRFTIQQELGYGHADFGIWYADQGKRPDKFTIKSRTQFRYYFFQRPTRRAYLAGEYLYKRVEISDVRWIGVDCGSNGGCGYFQNRRVSQGRFVSAVHAKAGWQFYFSNRTSLDLFTGFGLRQARLQMITPDVGYMNLDDTWDIFIDNSAGVHRVIPSLAVGFSIGVALGRFKEKREGD